MMTESKRKLPGHYWIRVEMEEEKEELTIADEFINAQIFRS
jgi:hypothetical protein